MEEIKIFQKPATIECDFEAIRNHIIEQRGLYANLVFTEDTKKDAKETVAELRKEQKSLSDQLKTIKKEYMKPFEEFSAQATEIIALYDEPIAAINGQITAFEDKRKEEKRAQIKVLYLEIIPELEWQEILPLNRIYNPKWENATATPKQIKQEMMELKIAAKTAITTINTMNSEKGPDAIEHYKKTLNLAEAVTMINNYEAAKRDVLEKEKERQRQEELERVRQEERAKIEAEQLQQKREQEAAEQAAAQARQETIEGFMPDDYDPEKAEPYGYMIKLTDDSKKKLEMFMDSVGIEYEILVF